jgi:hypothetical protein
LLLGLLSYLTAITHADIAFAVNNCARFSTKPRGIIHEIALERIVKYLLTTPMQGMVYHPDRTKGLECYIDANFARNFCPGDPKCASCLSRSGYVIMYNNCPIIWASKLQTSVALSTCEAEYVAMSTALHEVIPLMRLLDTIVNMWNIDTLQPHVIVHEDNQSARQLAMNEAYKPRTCHPVIKYHHFRDYVNSGRIRIDYIRTNEQTADILTKALPKDAFAYLRKKLCGWTT